MSVDNADHIIYNLGVFNTEPGTSVVAERYISRDQPFVEHIENYYF